MPISSLGFTEKIKKNFFTKRINTEKKQPSLMTTGSIEQVDFENFPRYLKDVKNSIAARRSIKQKPRISAKMNTKSMTLNFLFLSNLYSSYRNVVTATPPAYSFPERTRADITGRDNVDMHDNTVSPASYDLYNPAYDVINQTVGGQSDYKNRTINTVTMEAEPEEKKPSIGQRVRREDKSFIDLKTDWEAYVSDSILDVQNLRLTELMEEKHFIDKQLIKTEPVKLVTAVYNYISRENARGWREVSAILHDSTNLFILEVPAPSSHREYQTIFRKWVYKNILGMSLSDFFIEIMKKDHHIAETKMCRLYLLTQADSLHNYRKIDKTRIQRSVLSDLNTLFYSLMKHEFMFNKYCNIRNSLIQNTSITDKSFADIFTASQFLNGIECSDDFDLLQVAAIGEKMWKMVAQNKQPLFLPFAFHFPAIIYHVKNMTVDESMRKNNNDILADGIKKYIRHRSNDIFINYQTAFKTALRKWLPRKQLIRSMISECLSGPNRHDPSEEDKNEMEKKLSQYMDNGSSPCDGFFYTEEVYKNKTSEVAELWKKLNLAKIIRAIDDISKEEQNFIFSKDTIIRSFYPQIEMNLGGFVRILYKLNTDTSDSVLFSVSTLEEKRIYALKYNVLLTTCQIHRIDLNTEQYISKRIINDAPDCDKTQVWCHISEQQLETLEDTGQDYVRFIDYLSSKSGDIFYKRLHDNGYYTHSESDNNKLTAFITNLTDTQDPVPPPVPFIRPLATMASSNVIKNTHHFYLDLHVVNYNLTFSEDNLFFVKRNLPSLKNNTVITDVYLNDDLINKLFQARIVTELEKDNKTLEMGKMLRLKSHLAFLSNIFVERFYKKLPNLRVQLRKVAVTGGTDIYARIGFNTNTVGQGSNLKAKNGDAEFVALDDLPTSVHLSDTLLSEITKELYEEEVDASQLPASDIMGLRWLNESHAYIRCQYHFIRVNFDGGQPYFSKGDKYILLYIRENQFFPQMAK